MAGMDYDLQDVEKLGADIERQALKLKEMRARMREKVLAASTAGVPQVAIVKASRYTREAVRLITQGSAPISAEK